LTTEEEISGIFNALMIALRRILKINRGIFMNEKTIQERREKYEMALNPVGSFVELAIAKDSIETDRVIKDDLYRAYRRFCKEKRLAIESKENFGKILKKQSRFQDGREATGLRRTVWKGVRLTGIYNLEDEQQMFAA
jgi:putative DNA primase/helicase